MTDPVNLPVPLNWPALLRPRRPPHIVYLDMNQWIYLAQAAAGHPQGERHKDVLTVCRAARASGAAIFPLSAATYMELYKNQSSRQREDLAVVIEELSGFVTLLDRTVVTTLEVRAALDARIGEVPSMPFVLLGRGIDHAFGRRGGLRMKNRAGRDVTEEYLQATPDGAARLAAAETMRERMVVRGPMEEEIPALRAQGWDPYAAIRVAERRAQEQDDQRRRLDAARQADDQRDWRRGRLRDVVIARELLCELQHPIMREMAARGLQWEDVFRGTQNGLADGADLDANRRFIRGMPSTEVLVALLTERHRDGARSWTSNDIIDIDAMALAVPYCDFVVADKAVAHALTSSGVAGRMGTIVLRRLGDLAGHLPEEAAAG